MKQIIATLLFLFIHLLLGTSSHAALPPQKKNVRIELHYAEKARYGIGRYQYFFLRDIYFNTETKVVGDNSFTGTTNFDFALYHPLYDEIRTASNRTIPFYVEPGDTLIVNVNEAGHANSYRLKNGKEVKYTNLLLHDISNRQFYTEKDFDDDRQSHNFLTFISSIQKRTAQALDSVNAIADKYQFSDDERRIANSNIRLQFALWINEYAQNTATELSTYATRHKEGWHSTPEQDAEMEAIRNPANYAFMKSLPLNDSLSLISNYFPLFLRSYEFSPVLCHDQYLFYGTTTSDSLLMDSAYIAHELSITNAPAPSLYMQIALQNRHIDTPISIDDGSVQLQNVDVVGLNQFYNRFGVSEITPTTYKKNWSNKEYYRGVLTGLFNRKKIRSEKRARKLIEQYDTLDPVREELMKAYRNSKH